MELKEASPEPQCGFHGVLSYKRESDWRKINLLVAYFDTLIMIHSVDSFQSFPKDSFWN